MPVTIAGAYSSIDSRARTFARTTPPLMMTLATSISPSTSAPSPMTRTSELEISPVKRPSISRPALEMELPFETGALA